jgi:hypothetical protein
VSATVSLTPLPCFSQSPTLALTVRATAQRRPRHMIHTLTGHRACPRDSPSDWSFCVHHSRQPLTTPCRWPPTTCRARRWLLSWAPHESARTTGIWTRSNPNSASFSACHPCRPISFCPGLPSSHLHRWPSRWHAA